MQRGPMKTQLTKLTLEMKFMKRSKDRIEKEKEAEEGRNMYANEITEQMLKGTSQYIIQKSIVPCENLIDGRLSFLGMNPEIEKLMQGKNDKDFEENKKKNDTDVSDLEMAKSYNGLVSTMGKKFEKKRSRDSRPDERQKRKKMKFIKPADT